MPFVVCIYCLEESISFCHFACQPDRPPLELAHFRTFAFSNWTFGYTRCECRCNRGSRIGWILLHRKHATVKTAYHLLSPGKIDADSNFAYFQFLPFEAETFYPRISYKYQKDVRDSAQFPEQRWRFLITNSSAHNYSSTAAAARRNG